MKKFLVEDWREAWSWFTMHVATIAVAFAILPQDVQAEVLEAVGVPQHRITAVLGGVFIVARLFKQKTRVPRAEP